MSKFGSFPRRRPRRNRADGFTRAMVAETRLHPANLIWPVFVIEGEGQREPIASMPGVERYTIDLLVEEAREAAALGIPAVALFPSVAASAKSEGAEEAWNPENLANRAIRALKTALPELGVVIDIALDPYTTHGHDGLMRDGKILNDETVEALMKQAVAAAAAGADIVAPSDMMDGRVGAIRDALDLKGHEGLRILAYSAKYASAFYGPFRDAVNSKGALKGDKKTYQMDPANAREAMLEIALDVDEGADMVMVKPGLPYLDILARAAQRFELPLAVYHVSGEYAMLKAAAERGWLDYERCLLESLMAFRRAGASMILTYGARDAARLLKGG